jgi:nucleotide-binding universal stress UspA family protein
MISRILVPMDDSEMAQRALEYALENHPDAEITVLHVVGEPSPWGESCHVTRSRGGYSRGRRGARERGVR